jgi:serine/threonine protein kinase
MSPLRKVGAWIVRELLKEGGQGRVFKAQKEEGKELVAVKVLNVSRPKKRARFVQEVEVHASLSVRGAANIIPVLDHNLEELAEPEGGVRGYIACR